MIDQPFKEFFENLNKTIDDYVDISDKILECADLAVKINQSTCDALDKVTQMPIRSSEPSLAQLIFQSRTGSHDNENNKEAESLKSKYAVGKLGK